MSNLSRPSYFSWLLYLSRLSYLYRLCYFSRLWIFLVCRVFLVCRLFLVCIGFEDCVVFNLCVVSDVCVTSAEKRDILIFRALPLAHRALRILDWASCIACCVLRILYCVLSIAY